MHWEKLFKSHILERGYDYYQDGRVEILRQTDDVVEAVVTGSEDYQVNIYFEDGEIEDMYCDCPYAYKENNCKHMAALLYALENLFETSDSTSLVNEASPEILREFLIKSLTYNADLKYKFIRFINSKRKNINVSEYKEYLDVLIIEYSGGSGYIEYRYTFQFFNEAEELLTESTDILIAEKRYYDAYDILKYYYGKLSITDIDDDGNLSIFQDVCIEIFKKITELSDIDTKRRIFNELLSMLAPKFNNIFDMVFKFISTGFEEEEFLRTMLDYTDKRLAKKDNPEQREMWILYHVQLMDKLDYSDDEIMDYSSKYPNFHEIQEYLTERFIEKGNNVEAIKLLEDTLESKRDNIYESEQIHLRLKDLYKQTNDQEKYIRELRFILTQLYITNIDIYREFKSLFDENEWETEREKLYSSLKNKYMLPEYFVEEKMYDRLVNYVITNKNSYLIEKYESYLSEDYSDFILTEYAGYLNKEAEHSADRSTYRGWADQLRHMKTIKGGKECVAEIIKKWRTLYRNRPAMMQEIDKVEYEK